MSLALYTATFNDTLGVPLANRPIVFLDRWHGMNPAPVYADAQGTTVVASPVTNGSGAVSYYLAPGQYSIGIGIYRFNATVGSSVVNITNEDVVRRVKTVSTQRASTTTVSADPHLVIPVVANATYALDGTLFNGGPDTADFRMTFTGPAGSTIQWAAIGPGTASTADPASINIAQQGAGTEAVVGIYTVGSGVVRPGGVVIVGGTAGNVSLAWAQGTSNAVPVTLASGSWLRLIKITG